MARPLPPQSLYDRVAGIVWAFGPGDKRRAAVRTLAEDVRALETAANRPAAVAINLALCTSCGHATGRHCYVEGDRVLCDGCAAIGKYASECVSTQPNPAPRPVCAAQAEVEHAHHALDAAGVDGADEDGADLPLAKRVEMLAANRDSFANASDAESAVDELERVYHEAIADGTVTEEECEDAAKRIVERVLGKRATGKPGSGCPGCADWRKRIAEITRAFGGEDGPESIVESVKALRAERDSILACQRAETEKVARLEERLWHATHAWSCFYCDAKHTFIDGEEKRGDWARNHVENDCPEHPLRKLAAERDAALAKCAAAIQAGDAMRIECDELMAQVESLTAAAVNRDEAFAKVEGWAEEERQRRFRAEAAQHAAEQTTSLLQGQFDEAIEQRNAARRSTAEALAERDSARERAKALSKVVERVVYERDTARTALEQAVARAYFDNGGPCDCGACAGCIAAKALARLSDAPASYAAGTVAGVAVVAPCIHRFVNVGSGRCESCGKEFSGPTEPTPPACTCTPAEPHCPSPGHCISCDGAASTPKTCADCAAYRPGGEPDSGTCSKRNRGVSLVDGERCPLWTKREGGQP